MTGGLFSRPERTHRASRPVDPLLSQQLVLWLKALAHSWHLKGFSRHVNPLMHMEVRGLEEAFATREQTKVLSLRLL